jgi:hypothetical protein
LQIWSVERLHDQQYPLAQMETLLTTTEVRIFRWHPPHQLASERHWALLHEVQVRYYGECHFNI